MRKTSGSAAGCSAVLRPAATSRGPCRSWSAGCLNSTTCCVSAYRNSPWRARPKRSADRGCLPAGQTCRATDDRLTSPPACRLVLSFNKRLGSESSFARVEATMAGIWTKWEGDAVNGAFPLRRFLGGSDHSGVFLTEHTAKNYPNAAIKLVPADAGTSEAQLSQWRSAAALSHPHLIRLLDADRCRLGDDPFLFVVMEYAEETLAQILPHRALTPEEVRAMLHPTLDALAYLHDKNCVQGQLKPSNFLVVNDQLKLASDCVRRAGESTSGIASPSVYDPPEAMNGRISAAGDMWALGMTMVEALTQSLPEWPDTQTETAVLPTSLPPAFAEPARRCLSRNPADR